MQHGAAARHTQTLAAAPHTPGPVLNATRSRPSRALRTIRKGFTSAYHHHHHSLQVALLG